MRVIAVIQARMGSSRFPGKSLATIGDIPLLGWVLSRTSRSKYIDAIVLATSVSEKDDLLSQYTVSRGFPVYRGSEGNVLNRIIEAGKTENADVIVRICADNPFIDPNEIDRLILIFKKLNVLYACNHLDKLNSGYADGFGAEITHLSVLEMIAAKATDKRHLEHVTSYLWENTDHNNLYAVPAPVQLAFPNLRFDCDQKSDLAYLNKLIEAGVKVDTPAEEIIQIALELQERGIVRSSW